MQYSFSFSRNCLRTLLRSGLSAFFVAVATGVVAQQEIRVQADHPGATIQPTMWGIFFEDINMAADGGLYAELVKNRSFEFANPLMGWQEHRQSPADGSILVINRGQDNPANPRFIRVTHYTDNEYGISNEGFRGMGIRKDEVYHFSAWTRRPKGSSIRLHVELRTPSGQRIGEASAGQESKMGTGMGTRTGMAKGTAAGRPEAGAPGQSDWQKDTVSFTATATEPKAQLYLWFEGQGSVDLDMISLFPHDTWKQRPGGLRADLVQLLADLHPGFIRFPGGCIVEGRELATRYQWKKTVGPVEGRQLIVNRWNTEFAHRPTPDYYQSFGLGFFEYFQLAEDIGASPLPILNCGMACQFNTGEVVPLGELDPYIQDALDLIEFANGPVTSKWGGLRAAMGHPESFHLQMMGVGNEQWGPQYIERYTVFAKAIKDRYPGIKLVNSVGPNPDGPLFNFLNDTLRAMHADILDEHYYRTPDWFLENVKRYDHYDRGGPRIFAGEYAAQSDKVVSVNNRNNWKCAMAEAAFMTGLERNADVVQMASYAPLFAHVDGWQWTPDLIWFDNLRSYGTPDYYVQKLFSNNRGSKVIPLTRDGVALTGQDGLYGSACFDDATHELIVKLVNTSGIGKKQLVHVEGLKKTAETAALTVMKSGSLEQVNSLDDPKALSPVEGQVACKKGSIDLLLAPYSFSVIRVRSL
jgi:alpha-L-arabinofuranosidase